MADYPSTEALCIKCGQLRTASVHHPDYQRPNRCTYQTVFANLPVPLEQVPPRVAEPLAHLYVANDTCHRCGTATIVLRIEPICAPLLNLDAEDIEATTQFCPTCLEQLAREVRNQARHFAPAPNEIERPKGD